MSAPRQLYRSARRFAGRLLRRVPLVGKHLSASSGYQILTKERAVSEQAGGWYSARTAERQQRAYQQLLADMHAGRPRVDLTIAAHALRETKLSEPSILEVGCGGGYYSEILRTLFGAVSSYDGIDSSPAMIADARAQYPNETFSVGDACALQFADASFDIVFNGVSLMHIIEYEKAIAESSRVARRFCIFHSVPVFQEHGTTYLKKYAYGSPVVEVVFARSELLSVFRRHGLELLQSWRSIDYDVYPVVRKHSVCETYLLATTLQQKDD